MLLCCAAPFLNAFDHCPVSRMTIAGLSRTERVKTPQVTETQIKNILQDTNDFISVGGRQIPNENVVSFLVDWFNCPAQKNDRQEIIRLNESNDFVAQQEMQKHFDALLTEYETLWPDWK
jgi:hypothetical protein